MEESVEVSGTESVSEVQVREDMLKREYEQMLMHGEQYSAMLGS